MGGNGGRIKTQPPAKEKSHESRKPWNRFHTLSNEARKIAVNFARTLRVPRRCHLRLSSENPKPTDAATRAARHDG